MSNHLSFGFQLFLYFCFLFFFAVKWLINLCLKNPFAQIIYTQITELYDSGKKKKKKEKQWAQLLLDISSLHLCDDCSLKAWYATAVCTSHVCPRQAAEPVLNASTQCCPIPWCFFSLFFCTETFRDCFQWFYCLKGQYIPENFHVPNTHSSSRIRSHHLLNS